MPAAAAVDASPSVVSRAARTARVPGLTWGTLTRQARLRWAASQAPDARRPQAAIRLARAEGEAGVRRRSGGQHVVQQLRERRAVLEAVAGTAAHQPDRVVLRVRRRYEVRVGGQ